MNKKTRKLIYDALWEAELLELERYEAYPKTKVEFSEEFENNLTDLIEKHGSRKTKCSSPIKKFKVILVTALLLAALALTACAFVDDIIQFFIDIFEDCTQLSTDDYYDGKIDTLYTPTWVPNEYGLLHSKKSENGNLNIWENDSSQIRYNQILPSNTEIYFDDIKGKYTERTADNITVYYSKQKDRQVIIWAVENYSLQLDCPETLEWETIEKIINSVQAEE